MNPILTLIAAVDSAPTDLLFKQVTDALSHLQKTPEKITLSLLEVVFDGVSLPKNADPLQTAVAALQAIWKEKSNTSNPVDSSKQEIKNIEAIESKKKLEDIPKDDFVSSKDKQTLELKNQSDVKGLNKDKVSENINQVSKITDKLSDNSKVSENTKVSENKFLKIKR